jgi:hypothetical protein
MLAPSLTPFYWRFLYFHHPLSLKIALSSMKLIGVDSVYGLLIEKSVSNDYE